MARGPKHEKKPGLPPGTMVHVGKKHREKINISLVHFDSTIFEQMDISEIDEAKFYEDKPGSLWLNISGVHDVKTLEKLGISFDIHPLVLEDIVNTIQRPKLESFDKYIYVVIRDLSFTKDNEIDSQQISLVLFKNMVFSFQEGKQDIFKPIYDRLQVADSRIRKLGSDYLLYTLIDNIVDQYFGVLDQMGDKIEELEDAIMDDPNQKTLHEIQMIRRELIFFRKAVWPLRDVLNSLYRDDSQLIDQSMKIYLRDVYDHTIHVIDSIENYRDMVMSLVDTYMSSVSNRMNEVMKVLTIIATIFIPLTFIAGVYGMNFHYMPELKYRLGYPLTLLAMAIVAMIMLIYFRRKKWL